MASTRTRAALMAGAATLSLSAAAFASEFSNVIVFGDRFMDSGQYVSPEAVFEEPNDVQGDGRERFTNLLADGGDGHPWSTIVSRNLGYGDPLPSQPSVKEGETAPESGLNFAAGFNDTDAILNSITGRASTYGIVYVNEEGDRRVIRGSIRPSLLADPDTRGIVENSIVLMNGGSLDIRALANVERNLANQIIVDQSTLVADGAAQTIIAERAADNISSGAVALSDAGAGLVVVSNLMDMGALPESTSDADLAQQGLDEINARRAAELALDPAAEQSDADIRAQSIFEQMVADPNLISDIRTAGTETFNATLSENLDGVSNVVVLDQAGLVAAMHADPTRFGLAGDIDHTTDCLDDNILYACNEVSGVLEERIHSNGLELTSTFAEMLAEQPISVINAPVQISGVPFTAIASGREVANAGTAQMAAERIKRAGWAPFVSGGIGQSTWNANSGEGKHGSMRLSGVVGVSYSLGNGIAVGAAGGYQQISDSLSGTAVEYDGSAIYGTVFAGADLGGVFGTASATLGRADYDRIARQTSIGAATFENGGASEADVFGASIEVGVRALTSDIIAAGPIVALDHWSASVDGYNEDGETFTAVNYDGFDGRSTRGSVGMFLEAGDIADPNMPVVFRMKALYTREFDSDGDSVTAQAASSPNNTFSREGRGAQADSMTVGAQLTYDFGPVIGSISYDGRIGEADDHSGRIDVSLPLGGRRNR